MNVDEALMTYFQYSSSAALHAALVDELVKLKYLETKYPLTEREFYESLFSALNQAGEKHDTGSD